MWQSLSKCLSAISYIVICSYCTYVGKKLFHCTVKCKHYVAVIFSWLIIVQDIFVSILVTSKPSPLPPPLPPHPFQEFFGDYIAVGHHLFSFNLPEICHPGGTWRRDDFLRSTDGIVSVMLALRKRPVIRCVCMCVCVHMCVHVCTYTRL